MKAMPRRWMVRAVAGAIAALVGWSCGGGYQEDEFPDVKGTYDGGSRLTWDTQGAPGTMLCYLMISVTEQTGASFTGRYHRRSLDGIPPGICDGGGVIAGEVARDRTTRFELTQQHWYSCTAAGDVRYTGTIIDGEIDAYGTTQLQCEQEGAITAQEHIQLDLPRVPGR